MYLCSCKGLSESDVREVARVLASSPSSSPSGLLLESLGLHDDDACGLCAEDPDLFLTVAVSEWQLLGLVPERIERLLEGPNES